MYNYFERGVCVCVQEHWHTCAHTYAAMWVPQIEVEGLSPEFPTLFMGEGSNVEPDVQYITQSC